MVLLINLPTYVGIRDIAAIAKTRQRKALGIECQHTNYTIADTRTVGEHTK